MNAIDPNRDPGHDDGRDSDGTLPDPLRLALRGMRRDAQPTHDLFPGIAARLAEASPSVSTPASSLPVRGTHRSRAARPRPWMAAAAVLVLAVGATWQLRPAHDAMPGGAQPALMVQEADRMTDAYRSAWHALDAQRRPDVDAGVLHQIDASAAEVRAALKQDPDARFLFDRLQSLYSRRLDLAQRFAYPS